MLRQGSFIGLGPDNMGQISTAKTGAKCKSAEPNLAGLAENQI